MWDFAGRHAQQFVKSVGRIAPAIFKFFPAKTRSTYLLPGFAAAHGPTVEVMKLL